MHILLYYKMYPSSSSVTSRVLFVPLLGSGVDDSGQTLSCWSSWTNSLTVRMRSLNSVTCYVTVLGNWSYIFYLGINRFFTTNYNLIYRHIICVNPDPSKIVTSYLNNEDVHNYNTPFWVRMFKCIMFKNIFNASNN